MISRFLRYGTSAAAAALVLPTAAFAHTGVGEASGLVHGFGHPASGLDHILAMVMVGLFAYQLGSRALWLVPATFVLVMAAGGVLGVTGINVPFVEMGISGLFATFHGYAHGAEMPENSGGLAYAAGFMIATALLHILGIGMGFVAGKIGDQYGPVAFRSAGGLAAVAGVGILTGIL